MSMIDNDAGPRCFKESNIPVLKKNHRFDSTKRPKQNDLTELQKWAETVTRARNLPLKRNQSETVNTLHLVSRTSQKKRQNTINKTNNVKGQMASEPSKRKTTARTKPNDTASLNGVCVSAKRSRPCPPEHAKSDIKQCSTQEMENFLKKLYPNPYCLNEDNDFENVTLTAQSVRYDVKRSSQGLKTSRLLNMMFLKITDQSTPKLTESNSGHNNDVIRDVTGDDVDNRREESPCCIIETKQNVLQGGRGEDLTGNCLNPSKDWTQIKGKNFDSLKEGSDSELVLGSCKGLENEPENYGEFSKRRKPGDSKKTRKESEKGQEEDDPLAICRLRNSPNEYDLGKLEILTVDDEPESSTTRDSHKYGGCLGRKASFHPDEGEVRETLDISNRDFESLEVKSRSDRHRNKMEVRKLYDIVDKTTKSLEEITRRNEKELTAKRRQVEQVNRRNAFDVNFESNKFVQFIRKMNRNQNKSKQTTDGTHSGSDSTHLSGQTQSSKLKPTNNDGKFKRQIGKTKKNNKENESTTNATEIIASKSSPLEKIHSDSPPYQKTLSLLHSDYNKRDNKKQYGTETSFAPTENGQIDRSHFQFSESNRKIDEMLQRMQQFILKLDRTSSSVVPAEKPKPRIDSILETYEGNETCLETESVEENERKTRQDSSARLLSIEENVLESIIQHQTAVNGNITNRVQVVEETNELGGYNEEIPEEVFSTTGEVVPSKSSLHRSLRLRKKKSDSSEALKKALENEEKFLVNHFLDVHAPSSVTDRVFLNDAPSEPDFFSFRRGDRSCWNGKPTPAGTLFFKSLRPRPWHSDVLTRSFRRRNPNFVICVNSLSGSMQTAGKSTALLSPPSLFARSEEDAKRVQELPVSVTFQKGLLDVDKKPPCRTYVYGERRESLTMDVLKKKSVRERASLVGLKFLLEFSKELNSHCLSNAECPVEFIFSCLVDETKENSVDPTTLPEVNNNNNNGLEWSSRVSIGTNDKNWTGSMGGLAEAVESTETSVQELEVVASDSVRLVGNSRGLPWCSQSEFFPTTGGRSLKGDVEKTRVEELLMRTYSLQRQLHRHLRKISGVPPSSGRSMLPRVSLPDLCVLYEKKRSQNGVSFEPNVRPITTIGNESKSMQTDPFHPETRVQNVSYSNLIYRGTSCHSSLTDKNMTAKKTEKETKGEEDREKDGNVDGCSSTSSFKSWNDFSEVKNNAVEVGSSEDSKSTSGSKVFALKNLKFLRKIFSAIEFLRKCEKTRREGSSKVGEEINKEVPGVARPEEEPEKVTPETVLDRIEESKLPPKMLKTVFKGKDSTTELAIGLRDLPMNNISVEKKKFSPNHTKISISISKEESNQVRKRPVLPPTDNLKGKRDPDEVERKWKHLPLACHSFELEALEMKEEEASDSEEDDFKSVASSPSQGSVSGKTDDSNFLDNPRPVGESIHMGDERKSFKKDRFELYRKMWSDCSTGTNSGLLTRYDMESGTFREVEPLKKALTDMEMRMRTIKGNTLLTSNEYYDRALKLAKMSAGYCQCCGNRAVIPEDTFGYYKSVLPGKYSSHRVKYFLKNTKDVNSGGFYSFRSSTELSDHFCDLNLNQSSTYLLKSGREKSVLETSLNNLYVTKNFTDF